MLPRIRLSGKKSATGWKLSTSITKGAHTTQHSSIIGKINNKNEVQNSQKPLSKSESDGESPAYSLYLPGYNRRNPNDYHGVKLNAVDLPLPSLESFRAHPASYPNMGASLKSSVGDTSNLEKPIDIITKLPPLPTGSFLSSSETTKKQKREKKSRKSEKRAALEEEIPPSEQLKKGNNPFCKPSFTPFMKNYCGSKLLKHFSSNPEHWSCLSKLMKRMIEKLSATNSEHNLVDLWNSFTWMPKAKLWVLIRSLLMRPADVVVDRKLNSKLLKTSAAFKAHLADLKRHPRVITDQMDVMLFEKFYSVLFWRLKTMNPHWSDKVVAHWLLELWKSRKLTKKVKLVINDIYLT